MKVKSKRTNKAWGEQHEQAIVDILSTSSQVNIPEIAETLGFSLAYVKRKLGNISTNMGLKIVGITKESICPVRKAENTRHKDNNVVSRFVCKCSGPTGIVNIKVNATSDANAIQVVETEFETLKVIRVLTQEEHNKKHRVRGSTPTTEKDIKFGRSTSKRSIL